MSQISVIRTLYFVTAMSVLVVLTLRRGFRGWSMVVCWLVSGLVLLISVSQVGTNSAIPELLAPLVLLYLLGWFRDKWRWLWRSRLVP
jgi:hypothetical protein